MKFPKQIQKKIHLNPLTTTKKFKDLPIEEISFRPELFSPTRFRIQGGGLSVTHGRTIGQRDGNSCV